MPTYDYRCTSCEHTWESFHSIKADPIKECPECHQETAKRVIGIGGGVIFKGSGFYQTDYRSDSYKKAAAADSKPPESSSSSTDSKSSSEGSSKSTPTSNSDS